MESETKASSYFKNFKHKNYSLERHGKWNNKDFQFLSSKITHWNNTESETKTRPYLVASKIHSRAELHTKSQATTESEDFLSILSTFYSFSFIIIVCCRCCCCCRLILLNRIVRRIEMDE